MERRGRRRQRSARGARNATKLCRTYWHPVYAFVRRKGHGPDDALDLTQEFCVRFLERKQVKLADAFRGKFRSFLLSSHKNFLVNEWQRAHAEKRGGGRSFRSLEEQREAETRFLAIPPLQPDRAFEKLWALTMLDQVLSRLRTEFSATVDKLGFDPCSVFGCYRARRRLKPMHVSDGIGRCLDSERLEQNPPR